MRGREDEILEVLVVVKEGPYAYLWTAQARLAISWSTAG